MKRIHLIGAVVIVLILLLATVSPVMAKPVNIGQGILSAYSVIDEAGNDWIIYLVDNYDPNANDRITLQSTSANVDIVTEVTQFDSRVNMSRGVGIFKNAYVDLTASTSSSDPNYYTTIGSKKTKDFDVYYVGPGSIKGTITIDTTVYTIDWTSTGTIFIYLEDYDHTVAY
jgi:hypothetical protein